MPALRTASFRSVSVNTLMAHVPKVYNKIAHGKVEWHSLHMARWSGTHYIWQGGVALITYGKVEWHSLHMARWSGTHYIWQGGVALITKSGPELVQKV